MDRIYLDHAATSWPKPPSVIAAANKYWLECGASPGRGSYRSSLDAEEIVRSTRRAVAELIGAPKSSDIFFVSNGTQALNLAIQGIALACHDRQQDARIGNEDSIPHIVTTAIEHNSVLRALALAKQRGWLDFSVVPCDSAGRICVDKLEAAICPTTRWILVNHVSNVTGAVVDLQKVAQVSRKRNLSLMVDAAQSLGYLPIDVVRLGIDILAAPSHKGLGGVVGAGILYASGKVQDILAPVWAGGTGQASHQIAGPWSWQSQAEAGNMNVAAIAALREAIAWNISHASNETLLAGTQRILEVASGLEKLRLVGPDDSDLSLRLPVFSFARNKSSQGTGQGSPADRMRSVEAESSLSADVSCTSYCQEWSAILEQVANIECRAGYHCAGAIHPYLGTDEEGGTLRLSFGHSSTAQDIEAASQALQILDTLID